MIHIQYTLRVFGSVLSMAYHNEKLLVLDNGYNLYTFNGTTFDFISRVQISSKYEKRHDFEKSMVVSNRFDIFVSIPKSTGCFLLNQEHKLKITSQIKTHTASPTTAKFSPDGSLLAVGDEGGKLFLYSMPNGKFLTALKRRPDHISAIAFSNDNRYIAVSSFDSMIIIYDFESHTYIDSFNCGGVVEQMTFSAKCDELLCVTRANKFVKYGIKDKEISTCNDDFSAWPTAIASVGNKHVAVGGKDNFLNIVDTELLKIEQTIELNNQGITSFIAMRNHLFMGFVDGEIKIVDMHKSMKEFRIALSLSKYKEATELINQNAFLVTHEICSRYDTAWPEVLESAKELLLKGQRMPAVEMVRPFFIDKRKEKEFQFCLGNARHFQLFKQHIDRKDFVKAMMLVDEMNFLEKTEDFKTLDNVWYRIFQSAKDLVETNTEENLEKARALLYKFTPVKSKVDQIFNLLNNPQIYVQANKLIKEKNFPAYFLLARRYQFLESEAIYKKVLLIGQQTFDKMRKYEHDDLIDEAIKIGEYLKTFLPLREMVDKAMVVLKAKKDLMEKIEAKDYSGIYGAVSKMPELEVFGPFQKIHEEFKEARKKSAEQAHKAKSKAALVFFEPYFNIPYLAPIIFNVMKTAYLGEIEIALDSEVKDSVDWRAVYNKFSELFGLNEEIMALYRTAFLDEFLIEPKVVGGEENYTKAMAFPNTLLVFMPSRA